MDEKLNYRIGLDIGIASVGWAVLQNNSQDEPEHIVDLGVRIFDKAENPKNGEALAAPRRDARTTRRRLRRRRHRLDRIKWLLQQEGMIDIEQFMKRYHSDNLPNVYQLRYEGLDRILKDEEFAQVLIHIAKHRGFKSTRKAETKAKENGAVLKATSENKKLMEEKGYRTVGEMLYCDTSFKIECPWSENGYILATRNTTDNYQHTILRDMLVEEVHAIFAAQRQLGNEKATEELEEKYVDIMTSQRSFDMGPGKQPNGKPSPYAMEGFADKVGKCTFETEEMRAPKAAYTAELFVALQKINHTRLIDKKGDGRPFSEEERAQLVELLHSKQSIDYGTVRKKLNIPIEYKFNSLNYSSKKGNAEEDKVKETEKAKYIGMPSFYEYKKRLGERIETMAKADWQKLLDDVSYILTVYKNDDSRMERLQELGLSYEEIDSLLELTPAKFQHVSLKAMRKIIPYLEEGMTYDKACTEAGYDFRANNQNQKMKLLKGESINTIVNEITNPVVKRSVSQTIKVINAIIQKYGSPQAVNIELAREMSKNFEDRRKLENDMKDRQGQNERAKKQIQELGKANPTGQDILKYRLWTDQQGICLYSGKKIPLEELFAPGYDIDHILPYSITFDDSYRNKVLVTAQENRQKGNQTPYEYFGNDEKKWSEFETRVSSFVRDYKKQQKLLKQHFTDEERSEFKERNLTDTKYITRVIYNMIRQNLELAPYNHPETKGVNGSKEKKQVWAVNGAVTSYLRKRWGIAPKNRETDTHHAVDAVIIACCTDGMIQKITWYMKGRELAYSRGFKFVDEETGEIFDRDNFDRNQWDEKFGTRVPLPWPCFRTELDVRMADDPLLFLNTHSDVRTEIGYPDWMYGDEDGKGSFIRPLFVSRMPNHKVTGAAHADTIRSPRHYNDAGIVLTKTALTDLKLDKDNEIAGYYNRESDLLLYNALKRQLLLCSGDAKAAFGNGFHKPKSDGSEGPLVKKVKTYKKQTSGVLTNGGCGIAENGSMVRIDVFCENGKYFFVPVYTADVVKKILPNRAATAGKSQTEWRVMDDNNFIFSLFSRDLIHIKSKKGVKTNLVDGGQILQYEILAYYIGADISKASIDGISNDSGYKFRGLGIQGLDLLEKCQVDVLGNVSIVRKEKRIGF